MPVPDLRVYFWGRVRNYNASFPSSTFRWLRAGFSDVGGGEDFNLSADLLNDTPTDGSGRYVIHFPTINVNSGFPSVTSDANISNELLNWSTVPIVIVNASPTTTIEEVNLTLNEHYWGGGQSEGGFSNFWNQYKEAFKPDGTKYFTDGTYWYDTEGQRIPRTYSGTFEDPGRFTGNGYRIGGTYDTAGTLFKQSPSLIWNRQTVAFCPVDNSLYSFDKVNTNFASNPSLYFGRPDVTGSPTWVNEFGSNETVSPWASYISSYLDTTSWDKAHCLIGNWNVVKPLGEKWLNHLNGQTVNEFDNFYLKNTLFTGVGSDVAIWQPYQIIRGWLVLSLYNNGFSVTTPNLGTREGRISGKFYCSLGVTARYY